MDSRAIYKLSYGLFVVTARESGRDNGCIINTAIQVSSRPELISICVSKAALTHDMIMHTGEFTISVISEDADFTLFKHFGFLSGRDDDKFKDFSGWKRGANGIIYITEGTNAYISVKTDVTQDLGSHTMFIGKVTDMQVLSSSPSATYDYYIKNIKPDFNSNDSNSAAEGQIVWRCRVCGYEYVGEELPEDFICPLCKHPASDFEKVVKK